MKLRITKPETRNRKSEIRKILASGFRILTSVLLLSVFSLLASAPAMPAHAACYNPGGPAAPSTGLVGWWRLDDGNSGTTPTTAADSSGNGNTGTLTNGPTWTTSGEINGALNFNGTNSYVTMTDPNASNAQVTVTAWVKSTVSGSGGTYSVIGQNSDSLGIKFGDGNLSQHPSFTVQNTGATYFAAHDANVLLANTWYFLAGTFDGSQVRLYVNGVEGSNSPMAFTGTPKHGTTDTIGIAYNLTNNPFNGTIDDVRIYNRALSAAEVAQLAKAIPMQAGNLIYNSGYRTFEYCNGGSWQKMGGAGDTATGLKGWWKLDETSGTSAVDSTGNGNTGTLTNGPVWTTSGMNAGALTFNGTNQYIQFPDSGVLHNNNFTVSSWVYVISNTSGMIFSKPYGAATGNSIQLAYLAGGTAWAGTNGGAAMSATMPVGAWTHLVFTKTGSNGVLYVNGIQASTSSTLDSPLLYDTDPFLIGADNDNGTVFYYFNGLIDDVRLYNRALSASDVKTLFSSTGGASGDISSGLNGYWKLDEASGTSAADSTGNGNTGTAQNAPAWVAGQINNAVSLNGTSQYVSVPDSATYLRGNNYTIAAWAKLSGTTGSTQEIVAKGYLNAGDKSYELFINSTNSPGFYSNSFCCLNGPNLSIGTWYHVAVTRSGATAILYLNGVSVASSSSFGATTTYDTTPVELGAYSNNGGAISQYLKGSFDDARFYNRALSPADVMTLYTSTATACASPLGYTGDMTYNAGSYHVLQYCDGSVWQPMGKVPGAGGSGCAAPPATAVEGNIIYNSAYRVIQYCDGTNWLAAGRAVPITGLVGWWNLDEGSGTIAADSSGAGSTGTLTGTTTWIAGKVNNALTFDGSSGVVTTPAIASSSTMSMAFWFKTTTAVGSAAAMSWGSDWVCSTWNSGTFECNDNGNSSNSVTSTAALNDGNWHHIVFTANSSTQAQTLYVDGVLNATTSSFAMTAIGSATVCIGMQCTNAHYFPGTIDDVRIYNRALSASEVWRLYLGAP